MLKQYNIILQGKLIYVTAESLEQAEKLAQLIAKQFEDKK